MDLRDSTASEAYLRSIGATALADEVAEVRLALRVVELQARREHYLNVVDLHQLKEDRLLDDVMAIEAQNLQHGTSYNNIICGLGYAGVIGMLGVLKSVVPERDFIIVSALLSTSLISFVVWTAAIGAITAKTAIQVSPLFGLPEGEFDRAVILEKFREAARTRNNSYAKINRFWGMSFYTSLITGVAAAMFLVFSLLIFGSGSHLDFWGHILMAFGKTNGVPA